MIQYVVFLVLAPLAGLASLAALTVAAVHSKRTGFSTLWVFLLSQLLFLVGNCLELLDPTPAGTLFWAKLNYVFISAGPVLWFLFAMEYAGMRAWWLRPLPLGLLFLIPAVTVTCALGNDSLRLIWRSYRFAPVGGMLVMQVSEYGPWLWLHFVWGYFLMISGGLTIAFRFFQSHGFFRRQSGLILAGVLFPLGFNFIYLFKVIPGLTKDFSPVTFALGGVCFSIAILRFRLSRVRPVTRRELFEDLDEAILVINSAGLVVDINPAAADFFGVVGARLIGAPVNGILPGWPAAGLSGGDGADCLQLAGTGYPSRQMVPVMTVRKLSRAGEGELFQVTFKPETTESRAAHGTDASEPGDAWPELQLDAAGRIAAAPLLADILDYPEGGLIGKPAGDVVVDLPLSGYTETGDPCELELRKRGGGTILARVRVSLAGPEKTAGVRLLILDLKFPREIFSFRENQIIDHLLAGLTNKEIGKKLFVSENTIKTHLKNLYRKTGTNKRGQFLRSLCKIT